MAPSTEATPLDQLPSGTPAPGPDSRGIFEITSEAMAMTLQGCEGCDNDHILVSRLDGQTDRLRDGDIVVFHAPPAWGNASGALVLRVIAMGGETVKGIPTHGGLLDGVMVSQHGTAGPWRTSNERHYAYQDARDHRANFGPVTVPAGRVWVMGDYRNYAADSRAHCGPNANGTNLSNCNPVSSTVPISDIIGIATRRVSPLSRVGPLSTH
jgi:signal peptidase I